MEAPLDDRGLCLQEGQGAGAAGDLQGALRAVRRAGQAVQPAVPAGGPAGAQSRPPHPPQLALHLARGREQAGLRRWASWSRDPSFRLGRMPVDERFPFGPFLGVEGVISMGAGRGQTGLGMKRRRRMRDQTRDQEKGGRTTEPKASIQRQRPLHPEPERANSPFQKRPPVEAGAPALCPTVLVLLPGSRGAGV